MAPAAPLTARHLGRATLARRGPLVPIGAPAAQVIARVGLLAPDARRSVELPARSS